MTNELTVTKCAHCGALIYGKLTAHTCESGGGGNHAEVTVTTNDRGERIIDYGVRISRV